MKPSPESPSVRALPGIPKTKDNSSPILSRLWALDLWSRSYELAQWGNTRWGNSEWGMRGNLGWGSLVPSLVNQWSGQRGGELECGNGNGSGERFRFRILTSLLVSSAIGDLFFLVLSSRVMHFLIL